MTNYTLRFNQVLTSGSQSSTYIAIAAIALSLLLLVVLIHQLGGIKLHLKEIRDTLSPKDEAISGNTTAANPLAADVSEHIPEDELIAVFMAAITAYEADMASTSEASIAADTRKDNLHTAVPLAAASTNWNAPSTAGFRIKSIKRVS